MKNYCRWLLSCAAIVLFSLTPKFVKAAPYASCITNNSGTITFFLNENGASATVTFEDGTTNNTFLDVNAGTNVIGTNLLSKPYSFSLTGHSSYAIAVTKLGTGTAGRVQNYIENTNTSVFSGNNVLQGFGDPRGLAVNLNPLSPYFGRIYVSRGGGSAGQPQFYDMNADGSWSTAGTAGSTAGVAWVIGAPYSSPDKISIAANDDLVVGDYSENNAGVWLVDPNLTTNELLLGPIGDVNGILQGVHGAEVGPPVLLGNITNGATLLTIDGDLNTNRLEVYSNITLAALASGNGWQNVPDLTGPQVALNGDPENPNGPGYYFFPSLVIGPNGYFYSGEYRNGIGAGDNAFVQVYDATLTNQLWTSRYNSGNSDYFFTKASGGNANYSPTCVSVSPDGKYLAVVAMDNHITLCLLTNGIPNVATISTIPPVRFYNSTAGTSDGGDEIAWDAADNMYVLSASDYGLTTWTLGQSTTYTTYGNANGVTNFAGVTLTPSVNVYATNAVVISEPNTHGNPTNTVFTLVRSGGNPGAPLTVNFTYSGTAPGAIYKVGSSASVVFAAGQTVTNITVYTLSDTTPRLTTYLTLNVSSSMNYNVGNNSATISIMNTATPQLGAAVGLSSMYNAFSNDYCSVVITRLGDTNTTQTLSTYSVSGTAVEGTDYTAPTSVTFNPGDLTKTTYVYPLVGGLIPTHNPNLAYAGNKTAIIGLSAGSGFTVTGTATMTIVDSASPAATVLFFDPLTNAMDATNWGINAANGNLDNLSPNTTVQFGMNLYNTPSYPVPPPPNGATNALMITVNKGGTPGDVTDNPMTAVNAYFTNQMFSGDYAVRFNMNIIQGDSTSLEFNAIPYPYSDTPYDAEEGPVYGINSSGIATNWFAGNLFALGDTQTNFMSDGIWYFVSDNGGDYLDTLGPYAEFTGFGALPNTGWTNVAVKASSTFATQFKTGVFTAYSSASVPPDQGGWAEGGPGLVANGPPSLVGSNPNAWSDVEIKQLNGIVTMCIDKTPVFVYTNVTSFTSGMLMLGYTDPYFGNESPDTAVYYSNLRVVALTPPAITGVGGSTSQFTFKFTTPDDTVTTSSFKVLGAPSVYGPFSAVTGATITQSNGVFQASVPISAGNHFYRIQQVL